MDNIDLKYIKKHYGENFAKLCRELFPTILETPGALSKIISERFDPSPTLFEDISKIKSDFKTFVFGLYNLQLGEQIKKENKTAEQLFAEDGYILYPECKPKRMFKVSKSITLQAKNFALSSYIDLKLVGYGLLLKNMLTELKEKISKSHLDKTNMAQA